MNLCRYLVEGVVFMLMCQSALVGAVNQDEYPCPGHPWSDMHGDGGARAVIPFLRRWFGKSRLPRRC